MTLVPVGDTLTIRDGKREVFAIPVNTPVTIQVMEKFLSFVENREIAAFDDGRDSGYNEGFEAGRDDCDCEEAA